MVSGTTEDTFFPRKLRMGMIGGGRDAFIGGVHRRAARLDGTVELVAGCFSSTPEKSKASGRDLYVPEDRVYGSWKEMVEVESAKPEDEKLDFVSVVTPNHMHYPVAKGFLEAGFNVAVDKPMVLNMEQAKDLANIIEANDSVFMVTYNYTAYPMVKQARRLVEDGELGEIRKVIVEFPQGWLATAIEEGGNKHDANILLRFTNGAKGILTASQVTPGEENNLKIRVWGTKAGLYWRQETPNSLYVESNDGPTQVYTRGNGWVCDEAVANTRLPSGHPEGYYEAFANLYVHFGDTIRAKQLGIEPDETMLDFPGVVEGARGVYFIHKAVESNASDAKWTPFEFSL